MRVPQHALVDLVPAASKLSADQLLDQLRSLGFESDLLEGESIVYEVKVTPNRGDALSFFGLARDLQARLQLSTSKPALQLVETSAFDALPDAASPTVSIDSDDCTQYHGVILEDVTVQPSPAWLQAELALLGLRPINNIVDLTNYLMELYGQPLHAFDLDAILGSEMTIRLAKQGEAIKTLDGIERQLDKHSHVIQDKEALIDLAGIMGGANTAIDHRTKRIFLQSAIFSPESIKRSIVACKHTSPAAHRYARGVDQAISQSVLHEAISLLKKKEFGSNKATGKVIARSDTTKLLTLSFDYERVNKLLGTSITKAEQLQVLTRLGCEIDESTNKVVIPSWRHDLHHWQDLAEEVIRIIGLDDGLPIKRLAKHESDEVRSELEWAEGVKDRLVELGFSEIFSYSFIGSDDLGQFELPKVGELENPLNPRLQFLRPSLMPGLASAVGKNSYFEPIALFEIGHVFKAKSEETRLGLAIASQKDSLENWVARLGDALGIDSKELLEAASIKTLTKKQADHYTIRRLPVYLLEIPLDKLRIARRIPHNYRVSSIAARYKAIPKYPPVARDVAVIVSSSTDVKQIIEYIDNFHPFVEYVNVFDEFVSPKFGDHKKSVALHILYSSAERTLTQPEIEEVHTELLKGLGHSFEAVSR